MESTHPPRPNNIGKRRTFTSITGEKVHLTVRDEIVVPHGDGKLAYFQQFQFEEDGRIEYRLTYYMIGHKPGRRGRWVFGQYSLMLPAEELSQLLTEARNRGWLGI
ncbi:MAG: hypothetical protein ACOY82_14410 [Pseudomonadota bacterium]